MYSNILITIVSHVFEINYWIVHWMKMLSIGISIGVINDTTEYILCDYYIIDLALIIHLSYFALAT